MLLCGRAASRAALAGRIDTLLPNCDEDRLIALLGRLGLTALVGRRVVARAGPDAFPRLRRGVYDTADKTRSRGEIQAVVQGAVLERLTEAGIAAAPLKGPDLALRVHGDLALRPCADIDVIVAPDRLRDAVGVVQTLGYGAGPSPDVPWLTELHHALEHATPAMPIVEVHWRSEWYSASAPDGGFARVALERSRLDPNGRGRILQAADELAMLLLVYARDGLLGLRLPADFAAWWDRYGAEVPPGAVEAIVEADPPLAVPLSVAAVACARLVGLPAAELLDSALVSSPRARLALRLVDPFLDTPTARAATAFVDGLLSSRHTLKPFLRRRVVLAAGQIGLVYGVDSGLGGSLRLRLLQAQHPFRQIAYYAWSAGSPPPRPPAMTGG